MEFDKTRVYTALNADELKAGDKVIVADCIADLKQFIIDQDVDELYEVDDESCEYRFIVEDGVGIVRYALAYLVERAENCTNCDMGEMDEDDWIGCSPDKIGKEDVAKTWCCDNWKPKTEKKYRPFETIGELINEWVIKGGKWQHREKTMPLIWVRGKNCSVNRLITSFDETEKGDRVMICGLDCSMEDLFNIYTFLDGSPCGVEE